MALTRDFKETIKDRIERDPAFREELLKEGIECLLTGDVDTGKAILRDFINATIGFETLSRQIRKPSKSLHRMLSPSGNPKTSNFFEILEYLQRNERLKLTVSAFRYENESPLDRETLPG